MRTLRRLSIPLLMVSVVAIGGVWVGGLHTNLARTQAIGTGYKPTIDPEPATPKHLNDEFISNTAAAAAIDYLDLLVQPQEVKDTAVPWSITVTPTTTAAANVVVQRDSLSIGCRITVNSAVKDEKPSNAAQTQTFCWVKSA